MEYGLKSSPAAQRSERGRDTEKNAKKTKIFDLFHIRSIVKEARTGIGENHFPSNSPCLDFYTEQHIRSTARNHEWAALLVTDPVVPDPVQRETHLFH